MSFKPCDVVLAGRLLPGVRSWMVLPGRNGVKGDCGGVLLKDGMHKVVYFRVAEIGVVVFGNGMRERSPAGFE